MESLENQYCMKIVKFANNYKDLQREHHLIMKTLNISYQAHFVNWYLQYYTLQIFYIFRRKIMGKLNCIWFSNFNFSYLLNWHEGHKKVQ